MMVIPLMTCSARLPVYTLIIATLFPPSSVFGIVPVQGLLMVAMYVFSTITALVAATVLSRTLFKAPAVPLIKALLAAGAAVQAYDPEAMTIAKEIFGSKVNFAETSYEALNGADALALVTEWNEFREPDFERMRGLLRAPVVFDGRNLYPPEHMRALGFSYYSIGR